MSASGIYEARHLKEHREIVSSPILLAFAYLADGIRRMKHENYLMFYIRIQHHIKTGSSQPFKAMCQIKWQLININLKTYISGQIDFFITAL
ncbi:MULTISPECIES: hypothetical protein [Salmonella]|uniref:Uncharacterized protein n=12 Tax=Salmonella enterica TaxID=28901 RepID=A0A726A8P8_SALEP|nr:hypothetical protein [Salmonella enterica]pir/AH1065/ hypothetical protein STY4854 [imported] - Salmonella enterica subsp. enterica serovar Typhi (strain CT18) [Salmonella enterica subsp. enterica serovar Typhi]AAO71986.1 hypothetical protein t4548 [Salmonella enterica subsp. enterica serovar Typhi str. Ty2]EBB4504656.1 hypothetical protein [Salmonella enterica subsp. enterica serovar Typhimurium]EHQ9217356.1 hypothetical protein [Salmonella enterica subsp. enterica serovar Rough:-]ETZ12737